MQPMLAVDPAMLPPSASPYDSDSDYEYEYDLQHSDSFYLNLDLTSHHGPIRPARRRTDPSTTTTNDDNEPTLTTTTTTATTTTTTTITAESDHPPVDPLQILGLHTPNPIVSYQNQIFSCTWADQLGTELFFAHPDPDSEPVSSTSTVPPTTTTTPLKRGPDFDLIAANSVKLLGRKANLLSSAGAAAQDSHPSTTAATTGPPPPHLSRQTNQTRFLQQLKEIKQARGESDPVRTVFSTAKRPQNLEDRLRGWARTDEQLAEIKRLNDAAAQGDPDAIAGLEELYAQLGSQTQQDMDSSNPQHR
ncbi:TFIIIC subunit-domain-containing protein [Aspergillus ambiguus]|uniref:TFIIIC subunit 6 family protein n=1 Tax=Aspergillus ambiguus TaxID=176160 RepID=UPI003CCCF6F6